MIFSPHAHHGKVFEISYDNFLPPWTPKARTPSSKCCTYARFEVDVARPARNAARMAIAKTQTPFSVRKSRKRYPPSRARLGTRAAVGTFSMVAGPCSTSDVIVSRLKRAL